MRGQVTGTFEVTQTGQISQDSRPRVELYQHIERMTNTSQASGNFLLSSKVQDLN